MKPRLRKDVKVLVVDVSSSHVKCVASGQTNPFKLKSGPNGAKNSEVHQGLEFRCGFDWLSRRSSLRPDCPRTAQSGFGLVCFDFQSAFGKGLQQWGNAAPRRLRRRKDAVSWSGNRVGIGPYRSMVLLRQLNLDSCIMRRGATTKTIWENRG